MRFCRTGTVRVIEEHRDQHSVTHMSKVLNVSSSGYYARRKRPVGGREMANQQLVENIKALHAESCKTYGSLRIYRALKDQSVACSENRVARLMRLSDIQAEQTKRYKTTSKRNTTRPVAANLLECNFVAD